MSCLVIDDDPEVNAYVREMIGQTPFLRLAGSYDNALSAIEQLEKEPIDLIVLDINMPGIDGVSFAGTLRSVAKGLIPKVILISGSREYAVDGYKVDAVDYLVKPFGYDEFLKAALRVRNISKPLQSKALEEYLFLKVEHELVRVFVRDILYLESFKDYVKVFTKDRMITALSTLKAMEERLAGQGFLRIHRSFIINLRQIESVQHLTVRFGKIIIPVTEQYREAFKEAIHLWL